MKPHLPITLLTVLLGTVAAHAVEIPDDYIKIDLQTPNDLNAYVSNSADDKYEFKLQTNVNFNPTTNTTWNASTPLVEGGNLLFTSAERNTPSALSFSNGASTVFELINNVAYDTLSKLTFTNNTRAFLLGSNGKLHIQNVNDRIDNTDTFDVSFSKNRSTFGGAICANDNTTVINITNNGYISFYQNYTSTPASGSSSCGGAIFSRGSINLHNNINLAFNGNFSRTSTSSAYGGAIYSSGELSISKNTDVIFNDNYVTTASVNNYSNGGAIYSTGTIDINNNGDIIFQKNYSTSSTDDSQGGAIYSTSDISICKNKNVTFNENRALSTASSSSYGGAINSAKSLVISNNGDVLFSGNYTSNSGYANSSSLGGAIYSLGSISLVGNESVTFEKNHEIIQRGIYHLRSICMYSNNAQILTLGAKTDGHITFYDSVYMRYNSGSTVSLNDDYKDASGVTQKAGGKIVFSGKYTEEHLKEIKGGHAGTASEINNSRTSQLLNTVNLYGGTLSVEDKAVLQTRTINIVADNNATMKVSNAKIDASGYDITVNNTGTLIISSSDESSLIIAKNINVQEGASLSLTRTEVTTENIPMTLAVVDSISGYNDKIGGILRGNLNLAGSSTYIADGAHLDMEGGTLTFFSTTENKINLILTLGTQYEKDAQILLFSDVDTAKFLQDNVTGTSNSSMITLQASDYFTGEWINDETTLVYDGGNIYVSGVNVVIPEPTTATLSLLALVGLAARRRRK